jgi:hypothetical protein
MPKERADWVVRNMDVETRRAVAGYAAMRRQTIAELLYDELEKIRLHMDYVNNSDLHFQPLAAATFKVEADDGNGTR